MSESNTINYEPVFPSLLANIDLDLPVDDMANGLLQMEVPNYEGGFTTFFNKGIMEHLPGYQQLKDAIHGVSTSYMREMKYEVDPEKCGIEIWANVMRKGCYHSLHLHPHSHLSGTFYVACSDDMSPIVFNNPTSPYRMHEPRVADPTNYTPFTAPDLVIKPKPNNLILWPSWLQHHVPVMKADGPRISVSFNVDYLPMGV